MRKTILTGIMSLLALSMILQATANLVGTGIQPGYTTVPAVISTDGPLVLSGNAISSAVPAFVDCSNVLDPITGATLDSAVNTFWQPASGDSISPLQAIPTFGVSGLTMSPVEHIMADAMGPEPFQEVLTSDMGWLFAGV